MLYAIGFIGLFTIGGLTGLFLAAVGLDVHVTDTYFIIAPPPTENFAETSIVTWEA
jgi:heme/copper-type cytochrome/quinol oxidase subunit 1